MEGNPLECSICTKELCDPILLSCQHTVCRRCATSSKCRLCRLDHQDPSTSSLQADRLASFLLDASKEVAEQCANCEQASPPMFYCETCQQSLCHPCRQQTHQAKMFASHKIINGDERSKVYGSSLCRDHNEPYILYCSDVRKLVCIQCFNGRPMEERHSFISIDQGHRASLEKIEQAAMKLRNHQNDRLEELKVRQRIVDENLSNFEDRKKSIFQLCQQIIDTVMTTRERLIRGIDNDRESLNTQCHQQIADIQAQLGPVRLCLFTAQILCTTASKLDVLQLTAQLHRRINTILDKSTTPSPVPLSGSGAASDEVCSSLEARNELAKAVEPYLGLSAAWCPISASREGSSSAASSYKRGSGQMAKPILSKFQATIDLAGEFGQLFGRVEHPLRQLVIDLATNSQQVLEIQKDLTTRKCLIDAETVEMIVKSSKRIETSLGMQSAALDEMQSEVQEIWQEQLDRVRRQQILYRELIEEVLRHRETARQVLTAARQLVPYVKTIHKMNALIDPKRCHPPDPAPMESICLEITGIEPNHESRILAIEKEEENRRLCQEAKKKEELLEHGAVVKKLKHGKLPRRIPHVLVNTARERSPGGTDVTLISPCVRRCSGSTLREETNSELEEYLDENFDLYSDQNEMEGVEGQLTEEARCSSQLSLGSSPSPDKSKDILSNRGAMLQSLYDVFAQQKAGIPEDLMVSEESNVLASAVKQSEKRRKIKKKRKSKDEEEMGSTSSPPPVPFIPMEIFQDRPEKLGCFEIKERVLQSLKEKMANRNQEDTDEDEMEENFNNQC